MNTLRAAALPLLLLAATPAFADVNWMTSGDAFDLSQGSVITAASGVAPGSSADALLSPNEPGVEQGALFFPDGSDGTINFIEWETAEPVTLAGFNLWANGDLPHSPELRTIEHFKLLAEVGEEMVIVHEQAVTSPYEFRDDEFALIISTSVEPVTATHWRAEFTQHGDGPGSGPRIQELDGFADRLCGDGNFSGDITATDALLALKGAVGSAECLYCVCNIDGSDEVTATDALAILRSAVGGDVTLECISCFLPAE